VRDNDECATTVKAARARGYSYCVNKVFEEECRGVIHTRLVLKTSNGEKDSTE